MSTRESWQADVLALRQAAARNESYLCRSAAARLLSRLPVQRALEFTQEQIARRLAAFEQRQPGVAWPRQVLESILGGVPREPWAWPQQPNSGCGIYYEDGFLAALQHLWEASIRFTDKPRRITSLAHAIEDSIFGDMSGPPRTKWKIGLEAWYDMGRRLAEELERNAAPLREGEDADLLTLRESLDRDDGNSYLFMVGRLLSRLPLAQAFNLVREEVSLRLPAFERHHPGVAWPRQLLESLTSMAPLVDWEMPEDFEFSGPGANTLVTAAEELWLASLAQGDKDRCVDHLVTATSGAIMAGVVEAWGSKHPERWARNYYLAYHAETEREESELIDLKLEMTHDKEYIATKYESWLALAARCAQALGLDWKP
jgi:hypothetical protein